MEKNQNTDNLNQAKPVNESNQKKTEDLNKKIVDPNNPVAKDKQPGNQNQNIDNRNQDKPKSGTSNKMDREEEEDDDTIVDENDSDEGDQNSREDGGQSKLRK